MKPTKMSRAWRGSDSFRGPQLVGGALLLVYLLQCVWLVRAATRHDWIPDSDEAVRVHQGYEQWKGDGIAGTPESLRSEAATGLPSAARSGHLRVRDGYDRDRSPMYYLIAGAPLLLRPDLWLGPAFMPLLAVTPYLFFGVMLGGSLWYVARRLYGNAGGYIAMALYCFSPAMINVWGPRSLGEMGAVWGAFGCIFTAIAVAHTLYAPREVVLWNWRRILLLGLSLALATGNQFSLGVLALVILPVMLWVAPFRRRAAVAIWVAAMGIAAMLLFAGYFFRPALFWQGLRHASWINFEAVAFGMPVSYENVAQTMFVSSPPLMLALPVALITYLGWKRTRYFGNTAPLLMALLMLILGLAAPNFPGQGFHLTMLVFLFVFVSGVFADLLETKQGPLVAAGLCGLLSAAAAWNVLQLWRL